MALMLHLKADVPEESVSDGDSTVIHLDAALHSRVSKSDTNSRKRWRKLRLTFLVVVSASPSSRDIGLIGRNVAAGLGSDRYLPVSMSSSGEDGSECAYLTGYWVLAVFVPSGRLPCFRRNHAFYFRPLSLRILYISSYRLSEN